MNLKGLVIHQGDSQDTSAYTHRVMHLAECLAERSIDCDFLYMRDTLLLYKQTTASLFMPLWARTLGNYDFIYTGCEGAGQAMYFCRPFINGPIIYDMHGDSPAQSALERQIESEGRTTSPSLRVRMVSRMAMACADYLITVCKPHLESLIREGWPEDRVGIIRNGVDLNLFQELPFPERPEFTFGYAGAFQYWQRMDNLIEAFERVGNPNIRLLMIGFGDDDRSIKQQFKDKFGSRVRLVDKTDRPSMMKLLSSVSVLIIPRSPHQALLHAFPTKFAEYAAMGRPIMVNDIDETADFVRKYKCGFVSDPSPEAMAQTMEHVAKLPIHTLVDMGRRARLMAEENFSWEKIGDAYAELVRSVVARFRRAKSRVGP
ncbi:MAG: glycosyltransferase family 4 protein [Desulfomonile tiedjei]|nr:glycosyltransferase family 4 protein [Desulfomonile tiedjei]